jgi:hypothetical protein
MIKCWNGDLNWEFELQVQFGRKGREASRACVRDNELKPDLYETDARFYTDGCIVSIRAGAGLYITGGCGAPPLLGRKGTIGIEPGT